MAGADYLAMVSDPEELLSIARSIDGSRISQLFDEYQRVTQTMTEVGQFGHDVDNAASSQLFGKFVDEAHHESTVLSYAALNIADTCNRMKAKLSNFYEQYVEKVRPAAQALQQAYDAQLGQGGVGSPAELRTASTALAKALSHLYTDLAGNPTINVAPTFPEAAIPDIGADGRRAADGAAAPAPRSVAPGGDGTTGPVGSEGAEARQPGGSETSGLQTAPEQAPPVAQTGSGQAGSGQAASPGQSSSGESGGVAGSGGAVVGAGGSGQPARAGKQGAAGAPGKSGTGQGGSPASALGGVLGALGQVGSAAGSGLAGAVGAGVGAVSTGVGVAGDALGLGASIGGLAAQPASAEGVLSNGLDEDAEAKIGDGFGSGETAATKPAADLSTGGGGGAGSPHALPEARVNPAPEIRPAPGGAGSVVQVSAGGPAAASNGMMGMPMMGGAGMNGAGGEHRVANYLISKEQGERQFTAGLPLASEEVLGALDERERLAMQVASIDDPGGEPR